MASVHHISRLLPNNRDIWAAFPKDDYKSDIVARPRYARKVNAKAIISLHTDAGGPSATGTTVYYHEGRVASKNLADAIACSMKEIINATPGYENFTVRSPATSSTEYGENREAVEVPAVIVESGFHTNATDAVALRDTIFQEAAMKGVEKGYRVSSKGKTCVPQKITSVPKAVANLNGPKLQVPITFFGNPQFPVKRVRKITNCPAGWTCPDDVFTYEQEQTTPFNTTWWCNGPNDTKTQVVDVLVTLEDADGVKSEFKTNFTCKAA
ncbi:hypothetical protein NCPPB940_31080 [Xanthomonas hortorum pv. taraxaci]|nr:hypothetical protein NCPPB940_31080 [Xanthomonas hortorum pv. taraxaci]CAD0345591.1 hypothetical protein NCPPB940_31080 [Xanthomonas hortorum pv. taraxaci]